MKDNEWSLGHVIGLLLGALVGYGGLMAWMYRREFGLTPVFVVLVALLGLVMGRRLGPKSASIVLALLAVWWLILWQIDF